MSDTIANSVLRHLQAACDSAEGRPDIGPETQLSALGIHSLRLIELVYELEVRFDVQVEEELLARLQTVADVQHMFLSAALACRADENEDTRSRDVHEGGQS